MIEMFIILAIVAFVISAFLFVIGMCEDRVEFFASSLLGFLVCLALVIVASNLADRELNPQNHFSKEQKALLVSQGVGKYVVDQTNGTVQFILTPKDCD